MKAAWSSQHGIGGHGHRQSPCHALDLDLAFEVTWTQYRIFYLKANEDWPKTPAGAPASNHCKPVAGVKGHMTVPFQSQGEEA